MSEKALFCREKWAARRSEKRQMELQEVVNEDAKGYEWRGQRLRMGYLDVVFWFAGSRLW